MHYWTDMFDLEVVDEKTGEPVAEEKTDPCVYALLERRNDAIPALGNRRLRIYIEHGKTEGLHSVYPMIRHAARTSGFQSTWYQYQPCRLRRFHEPKTGGLRFQSGGEGN